MKQLHIGKIIKQKRMELNLTQEELSEGICDTTTLSRIENGRQAPNNNKLKALLQRLSLPSEKYYTMMSEHELELELLKDEVIDFNTRKLYTEALQKIEQLTPLVEEDDMLTKQFLLRSRVLCGKMEDGQVVPYTMEEKLELLFHAIRLTIPNFDIDDIGRHWYSLDEMKIINQMAITYAENRRFEDAVDIFQPLMKYLTKKFVINPGTSTTAIMIAYNYANILCAQKRYEKAKEIAQWGYDKCLEWGRSGSLGGLLYVLAECLYHDGKIEESKDYCMQSYYVFRAMKNIPDMEIIRDNIKEYYNVDL